jgi:hypothetical protein
MRIKSRFVIDMEYEKVKVIHLKFTGKELTSKPTNLFYTIEMFKDAPEYKMLIKELKRAKIDYFEDEDEVFSKEELQNATILQIVPNVYKGGYPQPENGDSNEDYLGVSFDLNTGCNYCTNGILQDRPLRLRSSIKNG